MYHYTTAVTATLFRECAAAEGIPTQDFVVRNDMGCGSTIGPILSTNLGVRTVDVGVPQLSMHSIREQCGSDDMDNFKDLMVAFFEAPLRTHAVSRRGTVSNGTPSSRCSASMPVQLQTPAAVWQEFDSVDNVDIESEEFICAPCPASSSL